MTNGIEDQERAQIAFRWRGYFGAYCRRASQATWLTVLAKPSEKNDAGTFNATAMSRI